MACLWTTTCRVHLAAGADADSDHMLMPPDLETSRLSLPSAEEARSPLSVCLGHLATWLKHRGGSSMTVALAVLMSRATMHCSLHSQWTVVPPRTSGGEQRFGRVLMKLGGRRVWTTWPQSPRSDEKILVTKFVPAMRIWNERPASPTASKVRGYIAEMPGERTRDTRTVRVLMTRSSAEMAWRRWRTTRQPRETMGSCQPRHSVSKVKGRRCSWKKASRDHERLHAGSAEEEVRVEAAATAAGGADDGFGV
ncbi:unnamed protein product [Miscanthus lutarioriparius]|uniref:Uncharacterized protein n=1 Tax=Miscanthus lutarioriparius TaxID=422564 RepID=A0A811MKT3_9POAL|nr:unnamed protein product [Miscanthus lutarioriparius]